jgi:uncharacterized protein YndB with AHSA1/START domain
MEQGVLYHHQGFPPKGCPSEFAMQINYTIEIESNPETVFSWLAKPEKAMVWMKSVTKTEVLSETADMVGTTFKEVVGEDGKCIEMQGIVTAYDPNKLISFHLSSSIHVVDVEYRIEKTGNLVRLTISSNIRWKFPMNILSRFIGSKIKTGILDQLKEESENLKKLCET